MIEFENDYGQKVLTLGHLTEDRSVILTVYGIGGLVVGSALSCGVLPVLGLAAFFAGNDILALARKQRSASPESLPPSQHPRPANTAAGRAETMARLEELGDWGDAIDVEAIETLDDLLAWGLSDGEDPPPPSATQPTPQHPPAPPCAASEPVEGCTFLDWDSVRNGDRFPHLALYGGSGDGKSTLANLLLRFLGQAAIAVNPHHEPGDFDGYPVVGAGRDYKACIEFLRWLHSEMDRRYKLRAEGKASDLVPINILLDEYPAIAASVKGKAEKDEFRELMRALLGEARKVKIRLLILTQSDRVSVWGFDNMGDILDCCQWFHLSSMHASAKPSKALSQWLGQGDYRAVLATASGALGADTTLLSPYAKTPAIPFDYRPEDKPIDAPTPEAQPQTKGPLEGLFSPVADSNYPEFDGYPMHQTVMRYIASNGPKDVAAVRERLRKDRGNAKADSATADKVISYLVRVGHLVKTGDLLALP